MSQNGQELVSVVEIIMLFLQDCLSCNWTFLVKVTPVCMLNAR